MSNSQLIVDLYYITSYDYYLLTVHKYGKYKLCDKILKV